MTNARAKKIELIVIFSIFLFFLPLLVEARLCFYCYCLKPEGGCELFTTKLPPGDGSVINSDTECNEYCYSLTTEGKHWKAAHCDLQAIDYLTWQDKPGDPCSLVPTTVETGEKTPTVFFTQEPTLQVPDLNVKFSDIKVTQIGEVQTVTISWLAEYIAAVYQYLVGVATILAIVMIMYGGFRWITAAGDAGKIGEAKKTITGAIIGLLIALGSYTILNLINPDLVSFKALQLIALGRQEVKFDEAAFGLADDTLTFDPTVTDAPAPQAGFVSYKDMMQYCPDDKTDTSKYLDNYLKVVQYWIQTLPKNVVYVGGGSMSGGQCKASSNDNYLTKKIAKKGYEEWNGDISAYRAWAASLGSTFCGDCLTFSRTLYRCVTGKTVINKKLDKSVAKYYYETTDQFLADYEAGKLNIRPGTFIWLDGGCGHAINYTGIKGNEIIEMGGGPPSITINNHKAHSVRVKPSLETYLEMKWIKNRKCPIYVHSVLEFPDRY